MSPRRYKPGHLALSWIFAVFGVWSAAVVTGEDLPENSHVPIVEVREEDRDLARETAERDWEDSVLASLDDPAFRQHVDLKRLGDAYLNSDVQSLIDIGLQLQEGELILQRNHQYFRSGQIFEVALRLAADSGDSESLDRLENAATRTGNKTLAESVAVSRQLTGKKRAAVPPLPEPDDALSAADIASLADLVSRIEKACALGNLNALKKLQVQLEESPLPAGELRTRLEQQITENLTNTPEADPEETTVLQMLESLSGESRAVSSIQLASTSLVTNVGDKVVNRRGCFLDAEPFRIDTSTKMITVVRKANKKVSKLSIEGLRTRYGTLFINYGSFYEIQLDARGNAKIENNQTVRAFPRRALTIEPGKEDAITVSERRPEGGWFKWDKTITLAEALTWALELPNGSAGPAAFGATPIVAVSGAVQQPERMIALFSNFTFKELNTMGFGATTLGQINDAKGGSIRIPPNGIEPTLYAKASAMPNGPTVANIVNAGGGNVMISQIAGAGGGGILVSGGGDLRALGATGSLDKAADALSKTTIWDQGKSRIVASDYVVNRFGKSIKGEDVSRWAQFISIKPGKAGEIINPPASFANGHSFFANARIFRSTDFEVGER